MVPDELLELDGQAGRLDPVGEALVQLRPQPLRHRLVGGVTDEDVLEAEPVLAAGLGEIRPDESLADE